MTAIGQIVTEDRRRPAEELEHAPARSGFRVREGACIPMVVLGDERGQLPARPRPLHERELQEMDQLASAANELDGAQNVGGAQTVRSGVGATELGMVDPREHGLQIALLGFAGALAHGAAGPPSVQSRQTLSAPGPRAHEPPGKPSPPRGGCGPADLLDEPPQEILGDDRGAYTRARELVEHPRMPITQTPGGAQPPPRLEIGDLLVQESSELLPTVLREAEADRAPGLGAGLEEAQLPDGCCQLAPPRRHGRPRVTPGRILGMLALAVSVLAFDEVRADTVTALVRGYTDRALDVLGDPGLSSTQRDTSLRAIARQLFDPEEAARRALGRHWPPRTAAERGEFTELFAQLLERTYLTRLGSYKNARLTYAGEVVDGSFAVVRAKVLLPEHIEVPVEARLHRRGERWYAYDIVVEGISLIGNYRAQFDKIIRTSSYEDLVRRLRERLAPARVDVK